MKSHHCFCQHVRHHSWSKKVEDQSFLHWSSLPQDPRQSESNWNPLSVCESRSREVLLCRRNSGKVLLSQIWVKDNFLRCSLLLIEGFLHTFEVELLDPRESGGNWEIIVGGWYSRKAGALANDIFVSLLNFNLYSDLTKLSVGNCSNSFKSKDNRDSI